MKPTTLLFAAGLASAGLTPRSLVPRQIGNIGSGFNLNDILRLGGANNFFGGNGNANLNLNVLAQLLGQQGGFQGLSSNDLSSLGLDINNLGSVLNGFGINGLNDVDFNNRGDVEDAINLLLGAMCVGGFNSNVFGGFQQGQELFLLQELAGLFQLQQLGFPINGNVINNIFQGGNIFGNQFGGAFGGIGGFGGGNGFNLVGFKRAVDEQKKGLKRRSFRRGVYAKRQECNSGAGAGAQEGGRNRTEAGSREGAAEAPAATVTVDVEAPAATTAAARAGERQREENDD